MATTANKNVQKATRGVQEMTRSTQETGQLFAGYLAEVQEINTELARRATETWIEAFRKQTELNQRLVQKLYSEAEDQTEFVQELTRNWADTYSTPFFNPFGFGPFREGVQAATRNVERVTDAARKTTSVATGAAQTNGGFPIEGYDDLNVGEISDRLDNLSSDELKRVREYEKRNKGRDTLVAQIDRKLKNATA